MSALTTQLEQLKKQQEELEKRIQEEAENKKKLNNDASIERLEALVEPITEFLDKQRNQYKTKNPCEIYDNQNRVFCADGWRPRPKLESSSIRQKFENENIQETFIEDMDIAYTESEEDDFIDMARDDFIDMARDELMKEEIYITLIGILKKQDERIKILESKLGEDI